VLGVAPSTIHRLLNDGIIAGEQPTPGAPWCIRLTKDLKDRFNDDAGEDFLPMREAMRALDVSRQIVLQRVKHGELAAVHFMRGKQKGLRIKVIGQQPDLFDPLELSDVEATLGRLLKTTTDHDRHPLSPRIMPEPGPPATLGARLGSGPSDRMAAEGHSREDLRQRLDASEEERRKVQVH
jgi:hypothetical protein